MKAPIFRGRVEKGRLVLDNRDGFKTLIDSLEGKKIEIVLRGRSAGKSDQQSRYYFGVVVALVADYLGYEKIEAHEALKQKFNIKTTTTLKSKEFQDYIDQIIRFAASEFHVNIPDPESIDYE